MSSLEGSLTAGQILIDSLGHGLTSGHLGHGGMILSPGPHLMTFLHCAKSHGFT